MDYRIYPFSKQSSVAELEMGLDLSSHGSDYAFFCFPIFLFCGMDARDGVGR